MAVFNFLDLDFIWMRKPKNRPVGVKCVHVTVLHINKNFNNIVIMAYMK